MTMKNQVSEFLATNPNPQQVTEFLDNLETQSVLEFSDARDIALNYVYDQKEAWDSLLPKKIKPKRMVRPDFIYERDMKQAKISILVALKNGPLSPKALRLASGVTNPQDFMNALKLLQAEGSIIRNGEKAAAQYSKAS